MSFIAKENAESYANTNALSGLNGGSGFTNAWAISSGTGFTITNTQSNHGSLSICRITGSSTVATYSRNFTAVPAGVAYFSVRSADVTASVGWQVTFGIGAGAPSSDIAFRQSDTTSKMQYLSGGGSGWTDIQAIVNDTWYRVGVEWDTVNQVNKFRYNINGGAWSAWVVGGASIGSITGIALSNAANGTACNAYFDDIDPNYVPSIYGITDTSSITDSFSFLRGLSVSLSDTISLTDSKRSVFGFQNAAKNVSTMTNTAKNVSTMMNTSKNTSTWSNTNKS